MGKKSRRKRTDKWAHIDTREADAAKRDALQFLKGFKEEEEEAMNNEPTPGICAATHERRRRRAVIAAAEAECRAAVPSNPPTNHKVSPASHPRLYRAIMALVDAVSLDEDDKEAMGEYLRKSVGNSNSGNGQFIKDIKRWPRIRKYWPRLRRRVCWGCGKQYDLSEPRLWVCGGCGEARYCDEACQRAHWPKHVEPCWDKSAEYFDKRLSEGASREELQKEFFARGGVVMG
jgi:hypothetical protein